MHAVSTRTRLGVLRVAGVRVRTRNMRPEVACGVGADHAGIYGQVLLRGRIDGRGAPATSRWAASRPTPSAPSSNSGTTTTLCAQRAAPQHRLLPLCGWDQTVSMRPTETAASGAAALRRFRVSALLTLGACVFVYMCARSRTSVPRTGLCMHACVCTARTTHTRHCGCACVSEAPGSCFVCFASRMLWACRSHGAQQ